MFPYFSPIILSSSRPTSTTVKLSHTTGVAFNYRQLEQLLEAIDQSGWWRSLFCSAALRMELHLAMLTASEKLRAGSLLQCLVHTMTDEGLESYLRLTPRCVSTRGVRSTEMSAHSLKTCLHLCFSETKAVSCFFFSD